MVHQDDLPVASAHKFATGRQSQHKNVPGQDMTTAPLACRVVAFLLLGALDPSDAGKQNSIIHHCNYTCILFKTCISFIGQSTCMHLKDAPKSGFCFKRHTLFEHS